MPRLQDIFPFIWNVCDDVLRGLFKNTEYGRIILPLVVLRRLDFVLEPQKNRVYELYQQYSGKISDSSPIIKNDIMLKRAPLKEFLFQDEKY
jgi:type I restriction enzyme M protein